MTLTKMILSLLAHTHLHKDKQPPFQHAWRDSVEDLRAWSHEMEKHDGLHAQYTWIRDHKDELSEGKKLVQREMHISAQLLHFQTLANQETSPNPCHQEQILTYEAELKEINQECLKHQALLADLESYKPPGRLAGKHLVLYGQHADPEAWKVEKEKCRRREGCCARDCGRCERNLRTVRDRAGGLRYLHCSRGCTCCERRRGECCVSSSPATIHVI